MEVGEGAGRSFLFTPPLSSLFFALVPTFSTNSRGNPCNLGYPKHKLLSGTNGVARYYQGILQRLLNLKFQKFRFHQEDIQRAYIKPLSCLNVLHKSNVFCFISASL